MPNNENNKYTDSKTVDLVKQLSSVFNDTPKGRLPVAKLDIGTGTYYADEKTAAKRIPQLFVNDENDKDTNNDICNE